MRVNSFVPKVLIVSGRSNGIRWYTFPPLKWQGWHLAARMGLIWVGKSTLAEIFPASMVGFAGEPAAASAAEEFAIARNLVERDSGTLESEDALGPAFVWPHP